MKIPKGYTVVLKRVSYCTIEVSEENGWDMPNTVLESAELFTELKNSPHLYFTDDSCSQEHTFERIEEIHE